MRKGQRSKEDALDREEFEQIWRTAREGDELDRIIFVLGAHCGMRANEIANITRDWINFQRMVIQVPHEFAKTEASARVIPYGKLKPRVKKEIERYFDYHDTIDVSKVTIWSRVSKMAENAGITHNLYPHALRATCALRLAQAGVDTMTLKDFMGWSKIAVAEKYIRASGATVERGIERIANNL